MTGAPALQEAIEVRPRHRVEGPPIGLQRREINRLARALQRNVQQREVAIEKLWGHSLAFVFIETAADEVGDVLHPATAPDVLEIDCRCLRPVRIEAEVGEFGIAVNEGLERTVGELSIDGCGSPLELC